MTTTTDRVTDLFNDAQSLYGDALDMLDQGKLRNAAEEGLGRNQALHRRHGLGPHG